MKKSEMLHYLENHFRYNTMNSWNRSTSFAKNMKIYNVIPRKLQDKAFEILEQDEISYDINELIREFEEQHDYYYQAGFNGRSGGYLVLYKGGYNIKTLFTFEGQYKDRDYADGYGWMDKREAIQRGLYKKQVKQVYSNPGKSIGENLEDLCFEEIKDLYKVVKSFDKLCQDIIDLFIEFCKSYEVVEEEIQVFKKVKRLKEIDL